MSSTCANRRRFGNPVQGPKATFRRRVFSRSEGEAGIELNGHQPFGRRLIDVTAMDPKTPDLAWPRLRLDTLDPVRFRELFDIDEEAPDLGTCSDRLQQHGQISPVRLVPMQHLDPPGRAVAIPGPLGLERGETEGFQL